MVQFLRSGGTERAQREAQARAQLDADHGQADIDTEGKTDEGM